MSHGSKEFYTRVSSRGQLHAARHTGAPVGVERRSFCVEERYPWDATALGHPDASTCATPTGALDHKVGLVFDEQAEIVLQQLYFLQASIVT